MDQEGRIAESVSDSEASSGDLDSRLGEQAEMTSGALADDAGTHDRVIAMILGAATLLMCVGYLPSIVNEFGIPRLVVGLPVAGAGAVMLARLSRRRDPAALAMVGLLGWSLVSALLSTEPMIALIPGPLSSGGWLLIAMYGCWWAIGRSVRRLGRGYVTAAFVAGAFANVGLAVVQVWIAGGTGILDFTFGRAMGFMGNPVYLGGFLAGAGAFVAVLSHRAGPRWWYGIPAFSIIVAGINLSGSRVALVGVVLVIALPLARSRRLRSIALAVAFVVGLAVTWNALPQSSVGRVAEGGETGGFTPRVETWKAGLAAVPERPLFGWGPARFAEPTLPRATLRLAQSTDPSSVHGNAHNLLIEQVTTTGVVGFGLLLGFGWFACRDARGPFAYLAAGIGITWLLEPTFIFTAPLAMLALGISASSDQARKVDDSRQEMRHVKVGPASRRVVMATSVCVLLGFGASVPYVMAAHYLSAAGGMTTTDASLEMTRRAVALFPHDPNATFAEGYVLVWRAVFDETDEKVADAVEARQRLVDLDPTFGPFWAEVAYTRELLGDLDEEMLEKARSEYLEALERVPWHGPALEGLFRVSVKLDDEAEAERWRADLCLINRCPTPESTPKWTVGNPPPEEAASNGADNPAPEPRSGD